MTQHNARHLTWAALAAVFAAGCTIVTAPPAPKPAPPAPPKPQPAPTAKATTTSKPRTPPGITKPKPKPTATATATGTPTAAPSATAAPIPNPPGSAGGNWNTTWATGENDMLVEINKRRASGARCGNDSFPSSQPIPPNQQLQLAARTHSRDMAMNNYFDHTGKDGSTAATRAKAAGYTAEVSEVIAGGSPVASEIVDSWMGSAEHCSILMAPNARAVGVGFVNRPGTEVENYWTVVVGD
ncbi:MAG: CAP domain-containing protein [Polyangiaceae bacterium]